LNAKELQEQREILMRLGRYVGFALLYVCSFVYSSLYADPWTVSKKEFIEVQRVSVVQEGLSRLSAPSIVVAVQLGSDSKYRFAFSEELQGIEKGRYDSSPKFNCPYPFCASRFFTQQELNRHIRNYHHDTED